MDDAGAVSEEHGVIPDVNYEVVPPGGKIVQSEHSALYRVRPKSNHVDSGDSRPVGRAVSARHGAVPRLGGELDILCESRIFVRDHGQREFPGTVPGYGSRVR